MSYSKLRRFLRIDSLSDQIKKFGDIEKSIEAIDSELNIMASEFTEKNSVLKGVISSSEYSLSIKDIAKSKFDAYLEDYRPKFIDISKRRSAVLKQKEALLEDKIIAKALSDINIIKSAKLAYRKGKISLPVCDNIIKAKTGSPVKYSDVIVFNEEGKILLTQRSSMDDNKPGEWCIPGGHVDEGEEHDVAAIRELREETNIHVDEVFLMGEFKDSNAEICYYSAHVNSENQIIVLDDSETHHYEWVDPYKELDNFKLIFDQKENIKKVLKIGEHNLPIVKITKAALSGVIKPSLAKTLIEKSKKSQNDKVAKVMKEFEEGVLKTSSGKVVTDKNQALAIALSEAGLSKSEGAEDTPKKDYKKLIEKIAIEKLDPEFFAERYKEWNKDGGYDKPSESSVKEFFQNNYEDLSNEEDLLKLTLEKLQKSKSILGDFGDRCLKDIEDALKQKSDQINDLFKAGKISESLKEELIEKARSGKYADTATNRRLKRVGQPYGTAHKEEDVKTEKEGKKEDVSEPKKQAPEDLAESAKNTSVAQLEAAIKESSDPDVRQAAHNELDRRNKEEAPQEEEEKKFGESKKEENEASGSDNKKKGKINESKLKDGRKSVTVGEEGGSRIRGTLSKDGDSFQIKSAFVEESERGKGKGKELYVQLLEDLKSKGVKAVMSDEQVEFGASKIYESLKKDGYNVVQTEDAVLEKDPTGDFWWTPNKEGGSPFEIILSEDKKVEKSEQATILNKIEKWL